MKKMQFTKNQEREITQRLRQQGISFEEIKTLLGPIELVDFEDIQFLINGEEIKWKKE